MQANLRKFISFGVGFLAGLLCLPLGILIVAEIFNWKTKGADVGLGAGLIISWYGLLLGAALGILVAIGITRLMLRKTA